MLLCAFIPDYGLHFHLGTWNVAYDCGFGAAYEVFRKRVTVFREGEGDSHSAAVCLHLLHHTQLYDVPVTLGWMLHFVEHFHYLVLLHLCIFL